MNYQSRARKRVRAIPRGPDGSAFQSRARKRFRAIPRGPDGSAFQKCENCGVFVAIALSDMHDCGGENSARKKLQMCTSGKRGRQRIEDQPRSAFHFFMEEFIKTCKDGNEIEINKKGLEAWVSMSKKERWPFARQAYAVDSAYMKLLKEEENEMQLVDDEADSAEVGIYDEKHEMYCYDSESSGGSRLFLSDTYNDLDDELIGCPYCSASSHKFAFVHSGSSPRIHSRQCLIIPSISAAL